MATSADPGKMDATEREVVAGMAGRERLMIGPDPTGTGRPPTGFADVGVDWTLAQHRQVEQRHVALLIALFGATSTATARVSRPVLGVPRPEWLPVFRNGSLLPLARSVALLVTSLRGVPIGCVLDVGPVAVVVGPGYHRTIDVPPEQVDLVEGCVPAGLSVQQRTAAPVDPLVTRVADDGFWAEVSNAADEPVWLLERQAGGAWGAVWYHCRREDLAPARPRIAAGSLVQVSGAPVVEVGPLSTYFDDTNARSVSALDLHVFRHPPSWGDVRAVPLTAACLEPGSPYAHGPVGLVSAGWFDPGRGVLAAVVPEPSGARPSWPA